MSNTFYIDMFRLAYRGGLIASHVGRPDRALSGAPKGNRNAYRHGRYSAEQIARRREIAALVRSEADGFTIE